MLTDDIMHLLSTIAIFILCGLYIYKGFKYDKLETDYNNYIRFIKSHYDYMLTKYNGEVSRAYRIYTFIMDDRYAKIPKTQLQSFIKSYMDALNITTLDSTDAGNPLKQVNYLSTNDLNTCEKLTTTSDKLDDLKWSYWTLIRLNAEFTYVHNYFYPTEDIFKTD